MGRIFSIVGISLSATLKPIPAGSIELGEGSSALHLGRLQVVQDAQQELQNICSSCSIAISHTSQRLSYDQKKLG